MTKGISCDLDYVHEFSNASRLLHNICRSHYCLTYEQWKEIFEDILEQVAIEEEDDEDALSYFARLAKGA